MCWLRHYLLPELAGGLLNYMVLIFKYDCAASGQWTVPPKSCTVLATNLARLLR